MKLTHLLTAFAVSAMIAPVAMAKSQPRGTGHVKTHIALKGKRSGGRAVARRSAKGPKVPKVRAPKPIEGQDSMS